MKMFRRVFVAVASIAMAAWGAYGADANGDIVSLEAPSSPAVSFPNGDKPLRAGESFYVLMRLLNLDYAAHGGNHVWRFTPAGLSLSDLSAMQPETLRQLLASLNTPKLAISIGGKMKYAEYSDVGPNGEQSGARVATYFTDFYFKYTVEPGDLGLPVKLICKDGSIPGADSNTDLYLANVNTASLPTGNSWDLAPEMPSTTEGWRLVNVHLGPDDTGIAVPPTTPKRDYTFAGEGVYVQTIDFDEDIDPEAMPHKVWRDVYPKSAEYVLKAPTINGVGPAVVYVWSSDANVFDVYGDAADITTVGGTNYLKVAIGAGEGSATFRLKGGTAATGATANIFLASSTVTER